MPGLKDWIGRTQSAEDRIVPTPYAAMAATLDREGARPAAGAPLPPLWHWLYFLPLARQSDIAADGHPRRGGFLPPVALPRRMWAGGRLAFGEPLRVGDDARRLSTIESVEEKAGRSGSLVFVTVRHEIGRPGKPASITEFQDIVYRDEAKPGEAPAPKPAPAKATWEREWIADEVFLFRYSALIFNGHRIHYDRRYVTEVERYPGLIVHGPLIATLLVDLLLEKIPGARLASFEFRAMRPLFDGRPFFACGEPLGSTVRLFARDHEGALSMEAAATLD
jgi:3-methylfumaryl-CoA hydratase